MSSTAPTQRRRPCRTAASPAGDLATILSRPRRLDRRPCGPRAVDRPLARRRARRCRRRRPTLLEADSDPIKPTRVYGELRKAARSRRRRGLRRRRLRLLRGKVHRVLRARMLARSRARTAAWVRAGVRHGRTRRPSRQTGRAHARRRRRRLLVDGRRHAGAPPSCRS